MFLIIKEFKVGVWIRVSLINFFIVALAGTVLRYKINFALPWINQKFLLHGHSHFAFVGWVSMALMTLMVDYLMRSGLRINYRKYQWLLMANALTAYGMLISFICQGYAFFSITCSTLSIFVSYFLIFHYWRDLNKIKGEEELKRWFKMALALWGLSAVGVFVLGYLMARHVLNQDLYFSAIYFFLHFQYNGWFVFACFGLLLAFLKMRSDAGRSAYTEAQDLLLKRILKRSFNRVYWVLVLTVFPSYFLSLIWFRLPNYLFWIGAASGVLQLIVIYDCGQLFRILYRHFSSALSRTSGILWSLVCFSFSLKLILQFLSFLPVLRDFTYRPVIIGYLHLCFLCVISFFILACFNEWLMQKRLKLNIWGIGLFTIGVVMQELLLMLQGLEAIWHQLLPKAGLILFPAAIMMATGIGIILLKFKAEV